MVKAHLTWWQKALLIVLFAIIVSVVFGCRIHVYGKAPIPNCEHSYAAVPKDCYSVVVGNKLEVRCPDGSTSTYSCHLDK